MSSFERVVWGIYRSKWALTSFVLLCSLAVMALFPSFFTSFNPMQVALQNRLQPPSWNHLLGTDAIGRDLFANIIYGARVTLLLLVVSVIFSVPFGLFLGMVAGYLSPFPRKLLLRFTDVFLAFPRLVLAMMIPALVGSNGWMTTVIAMSFTLWPFYTRLACVETMRVRTMPFVQIATLQGASLWYLLRVHILPFIIPSAVVRLTVDSSMIVLTAASLGFLGLGVSPDVPEWGALAAEGTRYLLTQSWIALAPSFMIFLLSFNLQVVGDVIRDVLDPKKK